MNVSIKVIPDNEMRPMISGADWYFDEHGDLQVRVSPLSDWRREMLLAMHETTEAIMCMHNGVSQGAVDAFDIEFDKTHKSDLNAGDDPRAPYVREHCLATAIERILCAELEVNWRDYDHELEAAYPGPSHRVQIKQLNEAH